MWKCWRPMSRRKSSTCRRSSKRISASAGRHMLRLEKVSVSDGGLNALAGVRPEGGEGQFVAIVVPNGAGKTTLFRSISGVVPLDGGRIEYDGRALSDIAAAD